MRSWSDNSPRSHRSTSSRSTRSIARGSVCARALRFCRQRRCFSAFVRAIPVRWHGYVTVVQSDPLGRDSPAGRALFSLKNSRERRRRNRSPLAIPTPLCNPLFALGFPGFATWVSRIFWGFAATDYANGATIVERPAGNPAFRSRYLPSRLKAPAMRLRGRPQRVRPPRRPSPHH
jgi:hypothetical protein